MKKLLIIFICILLTVFLCSCAPYYREGNADNYTPIGGGINIYTASAEELKSRSLVSYEKEFGRLDTAKQAADAGIEVLDSVYEHCSKDEKPFDVYYNSNANAWIVEGTLPMNARGGVGTVAIDKETGKVLMIYHGK